MLASFVFLGKAILTMHPDFSKIQNPLYAVLLSLALAVGYAGIVCFSAVAWKAVLQFIHGERLLYPPLASVYVKANIAKYLPGNFMHFAGRNFFAGRLGFSQRDIAFSSATEVLMLILTACVWSAVLAFRHFRSVVGSSLALLGAHRLLTAVGICLVCAALAALLLFLHKKGYWQKYRRFFTPGFLRLLVKLFGMYSATLLLPGIFMLLEFPVLFGCRLSPQTALVTVGAYTTSWVAGYIVPGAPGGIGIRETVLLLMLGPFYPKDLILIAAILNRIISIAGDTLAFAAGPALLKDGQSSPGQPGAP